MRVALTFDAEHADRGGSDETNVDEILFALFEADVKATFFVQGKWARAYPALARRIGEEGHLVGNHSHHHVPLGLLRDEGVTADVMDAAEALSEMVGMETRPWFRCPNGDGQDDPRIRELLMAQGYEPFGWDLAVADWEPSRTPVDIENDVVRQSRVIGDGCVVLLHTWPASTAEALPFILKRMDAEFVRLDEL